MNITFISDTHSLHDSIDMPLNGDVICHCGDLSNIGTAREVDNFMRWYSELDPPYKILIAGNHDISAEKARDRFLKSIPDNIIYLENNPVEINGVKFWGSPVTPEFGIGWAFNRKRGEDIKQIWDDIPDDTDVLLTHGPPYGVGDGIIMADVGEDPHKGCEELMTRVDKVRPKIHAFGHIHEARSIYHDPEKDVAFLNCSIVSRFMKVVNNPIKVNIDPETKETKLVEK